MLSQALMEAVFRGERKDEARKQANGVLDVVEVGRFHDGVHAAEWQGNEGAGDAFALGENLVGIGAGESAAGFVLDRDVVLFRDLAEALDDEWVVGCAVSDGRAAAEADVTMLGGINAGRISGMGDIEADAGIREDAVGCHHRAVPADFFLDGIEADQRVVWLFLLLGDAAHDLGDDVAADAVIEGAGDDAVLGKLRGAVGIDGEVADA